MCWILIFAIVLPWLVIGSRFNLISKIFEIVENLMIKPIEEGTTKKYGLFY